MHPVPFLTTPWGPEKGERWGGGQGFFGAQPPTPTLTLAEKHKCFSLNPVLPLPDHQTTTGSFASPNFFTTIPKINKFESWGCITPLPTPSPLRRGNMLEWLVKMGL